MNPPYSAKNGPIDDISELLLIKGVTPEIYYGGAATNFQPNYFSQQRSRLASRQRRADHYGRSDEPLHAALERQDQHQYRLGGSPPTDPGH